jgi:hypothetical protein
MDDLDVATWTASHEIAESATDPRTDQPAWTSPIDEIGDVCEGFPLRIEGHTVTALYSNEAAKVDARPCIPALAGPTFGAFADSDAVGIAAGGSVTVKLGFYSTGPTNGISFHG